MLVHQNLERKIEEIELINYMVLSGIMNPDGTYIPNVNYKEREQKAKFGIDILDTRLVIRTNNTWKDTDKNSISLEKEYVQTKTTTLTKYTSKGVTVNTLYKPSKLEAFVVTLEFTVRVPTFHSDPNKDELEKKITDQKSHTNRNEFVEKVIEVAKFVHVPIVDIEVIEGVDDGFEITPSTITYNLTMMNIDAMMEVNPYFRSVKNVDGRPLTVELMATMCQKDNDESIADDHDFYEAELQKLREAPTKKLKAKNEKLTKQFKDIQNKKKTER